jgi:hypothetical protein
MTLKVTFEPNRTLALIANLNDPQVVDRLTKELGRQLDAMALQIQEDARARRNPMHRAVSTHAAFLHLANDPTPRPTKERTR